jgi:DNA-binding NarL/FixJ family response regulator
MPARTQILVVDDHELVREGLRSTFADDPQIQIVAEACNGREALEVARRVLPDIALVDLRLPDMSGEDLCARLRQRFPSTAVIVLTSSLSEETVRASVRAGAAAYVTKAAGLPELRAAIERVSAGERVTDPITGPQIVKQLHDVAAARMTDAPLTPQQERVLELAADGLTNQEIGRRLFISESTVRFHIHKLKNKLAARSRTELIAKAIRIGVIAPAAEDCTPRS